jgi:hypothetical protein
LAANSSTLNEPVPKKTPAWMTDSLARAVPTAFCQDTWEDASAAAVQELPSAMGSEEVKTYMEVRN